ncbi:MAG: hypothetical protein R8M11_07080 [Gallionella sp.]
MKKIITIIVASVVLPLSGCDTALMATNHTQDPLEQLVQVTAGEPLLEWEGQHGGQVDAEHIFINNESDWLQLWRKLGQTPPQLDFSKYSAVAVMIGRRTTGGYHIEFINTKAQDIDMNIRYLIKVPMGAAMQMITSPWKVKAFQRVDGRRVRIENVTDTK